MSKREIALTFIIVILSVCCCVLNSINSSNQYKIFWNERDLDFLIKQASELKLENSGLKMDVEFYKSEIKMLR